jgi:hypothetical protein
MHNYKKSLKHFKKKVMAFQGKMIHNPDSTYNKVKATLGESAKRVGMRALKALGGAALGVGTAGVAYGLIKSGDAKIVGKGFGKAVNLGKEFVKKGSVGRKMAGMGALIGTAAMFGPTREYVSAPFGHGIKSATQNIFQSGLKKTDMGVAAEKAVHNVFSNTIKKGQRIKVI